MGNSSVRSDRRWVGRTRLLVALAVVASVVLAGGGAAHAVQVPATLADRRPVQVGPVEPGFPIDYVGVIWEASGAGAVRAGTVGEPNGAVRFRYDGSWGPWLPLVADDLVSLGQWASALMPGGDADAYQVRGLPPGAGSPRAVAINTTDGPLVTVGYRRSGASALTNCVSRAEWFADETLRFVDGVESWPTTFEPVQALTVHHTVTANNDPTPAATVRAIYRYHTVDQGWGDIAYQYLIDEEGVVYEGRWSGAESERCDEGGTGIDFGHDADGLAVTGGHAAYYNQGNLGVALLGDFTNVQPKAGARSALESTLAELATRHGLDPLGMVSYYNAVWDTSAVIESIAAHRDWPSPAGDTACPGDAFAPKLPGVRANVALLMGVEIPPVAVAGVAYSTSGGRLGNKDLSVAIDLDPPLAGAAVSAVVQGPSGVGATVVTNEGGTAIIAIRNYEPGCYTTEVTAIEAPGWVWDGATPDNSWGECGSTTTTSTTTTTISTTTTTTATTTTTPPQGHIQIQGMEPNTVSSGSTLADVTISGSGFSPGASVTFSGGEGPAPSALIRSVSDGAILLDIATRSGGPGKNRSWDLTVTNPDGTSATLEGALTVTSR